MNGCGLTSRRVRLDDGGSAAPYGWNGDEVLVRDDALTVLRCIELLQSDEMPSEEKGREFIPLFFVDPGCAYTACDYDDREFGRLIESAVWDVCGVDLRGDRPHEEPLWDPVEDAARIRISFRAEYGIDWDEARGEIPFAEFVALVGGCSTDTPLGRAIHYRNPKTKPKPTKHNRREIDEWERLHQALALRGRSSRGTREGNDAAMSDAFAALKHAAR